MTKIRCKIYREGRAGRSYLDVFVFEVMRGRDEQQMLQIELPANFRLLFQGPQAFQDGSDSPETSPGSPG